MDKKLDPYFGDETGSDIKPERGAAPPVLEDTVTVSPESQGSGFSPRIRVIGALVLVAIAVVLVPLIFSQRDLRETTRVAPDAETDTQVVVTELDGAGNPDKKSVARRDGIPPPISPIAFPPDAVIAPVTEAEPPKAGPAVPSHPEKDVATKPTPQADRWYVQMGVFAQSANAERLKSQLQKAGFESADVESAEGGRKRVRIGPYTAAADARTAMAAIEHKTGLRGVVRELP
jgi:DedD protein